MQTAVVVAVAFKIYNEEWSVVLVGQAAFGGEVDAVFGIRKRRVPAGKFCVIVKLVVHVPAQYAIAKAGRAAGGAREFIERNILASMHAIEVGKGQLHARDIFLTILRDEFVGGDVGSAHVKNGSGNVSPWGGSWRAIRSAKATSLCRWLSPRSTAARDRDSRSGS